MNTLTLENFSLHLERRFNELKTTRDVKEYLKDKKLEKYDLTFISNKLSKLSYGPSEVFRVENYKDPRQTLILRTEGIISSIFDKINSMLQWLIDSLSGLFGKSSKTSSSGSSSGGGSGERTSKKLGKKAKGEDSATTSQKQIVSNNNKIIFHNLKNFVYFNHKDTTEAIKQLKDVETYFKKLKEIFDNILKISNSKTIVDFSNYSSQIKDGIIKILAHYSENKTTYPDSLGVFKFTPNSEIVAVESNGSVFKFNHEKQTDKGSSIEANKDTFDPYVIQLVETLKVLESLFVKETNDLKNRLELLKNTKDQYEREENFNQAKIMMLEINIAVTITIQLNRINKFLDTLAIDYNNLTAD